MKRTDRESSRTGASRASRHGDEATFETLLGRLRDLPQGHRGSILDGELWVTEPATGCRAHTLAEIWAMLLAGPSLGDPVPEGWSFLAAPELRVEPEGLLVADLAGWRLPAGEVAGGPPSHAPPWVCEVLPPMHSPARVFVLTAKRDAYAGMGVEHLWVVDPEAEVLEVFHNDRGHWTLLQALSQEAEVAAMPFGGMRFDARELWVVPSDPLGSPRRGPSSKRK